MILNHIIKIGKGIDEPADYWKKYQFISGVVIPKQIPRTKLKT